MKNIKIDDTLHKELKKLAAEKGISLLKLAAKLLTEGVKNELAK
jgi:predicted HicB family RNase H-like nuclease